MVAAVVAPENTVVAEFAVPDAVLDASIEETPDALDSPLVMLDVREIKGLEFDGVVVVDPQAILDGADRGSGDLYVAVTRATTRLAVVHPGPLPDMLARLKD